jgi:hypothetical protein
LIVAAYFTAGWIVGICYSRWGPHGGTARLLPALVPAAAMEFLITPDFGGADIDVLASWRGEPHLAVTMLGGGAVVAAAVAFARRLTREANLT